MPGLQPQSALLRLLRKESVFAVVSYRLAGLQVWEEVWLEEKAFDGRLLVD